MSRFTFPLVVLLALVLPLAAGERQQSYSLSVNVDLVVLNVRVLDRDGRSVSDIPEEAFRVEEDGKAQNISLFVGEDSPGTIGLVLDSSASINSTQSAIRAAALRFVQSGKPADQIFVLQFNERLYWMLPEELPFTNNIDLLHQALAWTPAAGRTALYDAISAAITEAGRGAWEKRTLIVLTDGGDNASRKTLTDVLRLAQESNVTVHTIGLFDPLSAENNRPVLRELAELTGGDVYFPATIEELGPAWSKISERVRSQYTIGYRPSQSSFDGKFHKIRVRVDRPGYEKVTVHTRPGYRARTMPSEP